MKLPEWAVQGIMGAAGGVGLALVAGVAFQSYIASVPPVTVNSTGEAWIERGHVHIKMLATRDRDCPFEVMTEWLDRENRKRSKVNKNRVIADKGDPEAIIIVDDIPVSMPPGTYMVRSVAEYDCAGTLFKVATDWRKVEWRQQ